MVQGEFQCFPPCSWITAIRTLGIEPTFRSVSGFSVPFGLLITGVSVTTGFNKLLPRWVVILGLVVAMTRELGWLDILFPKALLLIPLIRFPGFVWLIAAGFALPNTVDREKRKR
jgi:hypothetical protein